MIFPIGEGQNALPDSQGKATDLDRYVRRWRFEGDRVPVTRADTEEPKPRVAIQVQ